MFLHFLLAFAHCGLQELRRTVAHAGGANWFEPNEIIFGWRIDAYYALCLSDMCYSTVVQ